MTGFIHHVCYLAGRENIDVVVLKADEIKLFRWKKIIARKWNIFLFFLLF
jgi:hypothetical protein